MNGHAKLVMSGAAVGWAVGLLGPGCARAPSPDVAEITSAVEDRAERGPVQLTVRVTPDAVTVGEPLRLEIDVLAEDGVEMQMPRLSDRLGVFAVSDARTPPDVPEGARRRWSHGYALSTYEAGELEVPAITVGFDDRRVADQITGELSAGPLTVTVASVLGAEADPSQLRDIKPAEQVPVPLPRRWWLLPVCAALVVAGVVAAAWWWWRRRNRPEAPPSPVPAHVWALAELDRLKAERLVEPERIHAFYYRLSDIVRQYIERRFALSAPERTTEEFIREMRHHPVLAEQHQTLLAGFLRAADMVKFALHRPGHEQCDAALDTARRFVEQTASIADEPLVSGREGVAA